MRAAIYLKNNIVCKTNNIQKKLKKESAPIEILEEWEYNNDSKKLDEKYNYWNRVLAKNTAEEKSEEVKLYHFKNPKTGETISSIYYNLDNIPNINKEEWYVVA